MTRRTEADEPAVLDAAEDLARVVRRTLRARGEAGKFPVAAIMVVASEDGTIVTFSVPAQREPVLSSLLRDAAARVDGGAPEVNRTVPCDCPKCIAGGLH